MKTLDEVIEKYEAIPYLSPLEEDALHYLKEYRSDKAMWKADRKGHLDWIEQYKEAREKHQTAVIELKHKEKEVNAILTDYVALKQYWAEQQANPPLSWDELRTMKNKPVWVEGYYPSAWYIVREVQKNKDGTEDIILDGFQGLTGIGRDDKYGDLENGWQAYRKERE